MTIEQDIAAVRNHSKFWKKSAPEIHFYQAVDRILDRLEELEKANVTISYVNKKFEEFRATQKILMEALEELEKAEQLYRLSHDQHGDGSRESGHSWDKLRYAGNKAREALSKVKREG